MGRHEKLQGKHRSLPSRRKTLNRKTNSPAPSYESLEPKNLLAVDVFNLTHTATLSPASLGLPSTSSAKIEPTHFYVADGQQVGMTISNDRVAISRSHNVLNQQHAQILRGYTLEETRSLVNSNFSVFASDRPLDDDFFTAALDSGWASSIVPVFQVGEAETEAVLLNEVIVRLPGTTDAAEYFDSDRFDGYYRLAGTPDQFVATLSAGYGEAALAEINQLAQEKDLVWVAPNFHQKWERFYTPNDPRWANMWTLHHTGQQMGGPNAVPGLADTDVNMPEAWDIKQGSNASIVVGVLDDGVPFNHPDLLVYQGDANAFTDSNGNGWVGDLHGWDFVNNNNNSHPVASTDAHGTAVAGIAAARGDNGLGVVGAAYGSPVLSARMFAGSDVATDAQIASAMYYLSGRTFDGTGQWDAAAVVNHSWGGGGVSVAINDALQWATNEARGGLGVTQFFASGNSPGLIGNPANQAAVNEGVVVVGSINNAGQLSSYHSRGPLLDIVTPSNDFVTGPGGEQIYLAIDSTDRVGISGYAPGDYTGTGANGFGGTSAAAPLAAGVAALALAHADDLGVDITAAELRKLLRTNTKLAGGEFYDVLNGGHGFDGGHGLLNAESLLRGIGNVQLSVTTNFVEVADASTGWTFGNVFTKSLTEGILRIRNQGTEDLTYSISVSGSSAYSITESGPGTLGLGEGTSFTIEFNPLTVGTHTAEITINSNDPTAPSFTFEIESEAVQAQVNGFLFEDYNGDGSQQTFESQVAGVPILFDTNGNGVADTFNIDTFSDAPNLGFDHTAAAITSISVSGLTDFVTDVDVKLNVTHTWVADMVIFLEAPNGDFSQLFNQRGGSADNLTNTIFDDQAPLAISEGAAPFTGSFRPETPLSIFNGMSASEANGDWTLYIFDVAAGDNGVLLNWELDIATGEATVITDAFGFYAYDNLEIGNYDAVPLLPAAWSMSPGSASSYPIVITGSGDEHDCSDFGIGVNDRFYANVFNDLNGDGIVDDGETGRGNRVLFLDGNNNGTLDGSVVDNFFDNPNLTVPDNTTVQTSQTVSGLVGLVEDINVTVNMTHTWIGDIQIWLEDPTGTEVLLFNRHGGNGDNLVNTVFDDSAANLISSGVAPFTGSWRPIEALSVFNGMDPNGDWILRLRDNANGDVGTLLNWNLEITTNPDIAFSTNSDGWALFDLPAGNHDMILTEDGWSFTVPVDGIINVTTSGVPLFNQTYGERDAVAEVLGSFVYYGGSAFSSWDRLDSVKMLAKEGANPQTLSFDNLTNSTRGINGIVFDIDNLAGSLTVDDFVFQMSPQGNFNEGDNLPADWITAPSPSGISITPGSPDRVLVEWPNNVIENRWLRITVKANAKTGLPADEVYYIGHLLGEVSGLSGTSYSVTVLDAVQISGQASPNAVGSSNIWDINKSGNVTVLDIINMTGAIGTRVLRNITIPGNGGASMQFFAGGNDGSRDFDKADQQTRSNPKDWVFGGISDFDIASREIVSSPINESQLRKNADADRYFEDFALSAPKTQLLEVESFKFQSFFTDDDVESDSLSTESNLNSEISIDRQLSFRL